MRAGEEGRDFQKRHRNRQGERHQGKERERETEREREWTLPGVEKEREEPKAVSSCHHPELSLASEPQPEQKYLSLLNPQLTPQHVTTSISTPLSEAQETRWLSGHRPRFYRLFSFFPADKGTPS